MKQTAQVSASCNALALRVEVRPLSKEAKKKKKIICIIYIYILSNSLIGPLMEVKDILATTNAKQSTSALKAMGKGTFYANK